MVLVFGGTTEGRQAIAALEEAGSTYYYSTKTGEQEVVLHHGVRTDGALDGEAMLHFCQEHGIRLIADAAHPFAQVLHQTIASVAQTLDIPVVRFERIYPPRDPDITWIDDYREVPTNVSTLLATTGVQSISRLQWLEERGVRIIYRILNRESSIALARKQGARDEQLCYYEDPADMPPGADALLLKESGLTGGFVEKVEEARRRGMRIITLRRPAMPESFATVDGEHGLRRMVERLLPEFFPLKSGLTTGTCATAAAVAATIRLTKGEMPKEVPVHLPNGETIRVPVGYADGYAYCIKEAGDDPDVTDGIEIRAYPRPIPKGGEGIVIEGGEGIGRFTLPGFDFPPGEAAINRVPREMIRENIKSLCNQLSIFNFQFSITLSVPNGAEIAKRTFNPRLGIEGGISIIGVSGIVMPYSEEAFIQSIRKCMEVARASGSERIVIGSGMKSEQQLRRLYPTLPHQAFVEYGNYIGETLKIADEMAINCITLGIMIGKAVKLAQGHLDTHSHKTTMDVGFIQEMLTEAGIDIAINDITLARELWKKIPETQIEDFCRVIITRCMRHCKALLPNGRLTILLIDDDGTIHSLSRAHRPAP